MTSTCLFDIQTTGLYWRNSRITYIGIAYPTDTSFSFYEWHLSDEKDEPDVLEEVQERLSKFQTVITYNGTGFDFPYLKNKYKAYGIPSILPTRTHIDLLRIFTPYKHILRFLSMKQVDLEFFLGYERTEELLDTKKIQETDLHGMIHLLELFAYKELFNGHFCISNAGVIHSNAYLITCILEHALPKPFSYSHGPYYLSGEGTSFKLKITLCSKTLKLFYSNYKDYYYLPYEDVALHKSVATYVDKDYRTQAKASNCYSRLDGIFLPQVAASFTPQVRDSYEDKDFYFPIQREFTEDKSQQYCYVQEVLHDLLSTKS